jgi:hypothetical protein
MKAEECANPCWGKTKSFPSVAPLPQPFYFTKKVTGRQHTLQHQKVKRFGTHTQRDKCVQRHRQIHKHSNTNWRGWLPYISLSVSMVARLCCALFRMGGVYEGGLRDYQRGNASLWACPPLSQSALRAGAVVQWHNTTPGYRAIRSVHSNETLWFVSRIRLNKHKLKTKDRMGANSNKRKLVFCLVFLGHRTI